MEVLLHPLESTLRKYRVIVTSVLDSSILSRFTFTNNSLAQLEHSILSQWQPEAYHPQHYHFDYFILDEAAQLSELDIAPALAVMLPSAATRANDVHKTRRLPQLCLVGDFQQLGPFVSAPEARAAELDLSMLQRLFERSLYKDHPKARQNLEWKAPALLMPSLNGRNNKVATPAADEEEDLSPPLCNLVKNYRSHVGLIMVPSTSFYNDTLQPFAPEAVQNTPLLKWPALPSKAIPLLLWHTEGREDMIDEGSSFFNEEEIDRVVSIVQELVKDSVHFAKEAPVKPADISIISPFREQVWKIRIRLRLLGLGEVNVGRESDMQGAENRVVVISPVRTSSRFLADDRRRNRGLIYEPKRFNVATTRSKELLIICGHVPTLHEDPHWRALIHFSIRRGCYKGLTLQEVGITVDATTGVGKLEEVYVEKHGSLTQGEDTLAGSMARVVLEEER
jgi:superfamily I DNA and/or RNA helicase